MADITLTLLTVDEREQFILDNQYAFKYGAMKEFREQDNQFEEKEEVISRETIENSIDNGVAYCIREDGKNVGGLVVKIDERSQHNELELLFVHPRAHSNGIGYAAWQEVERFTPTLSFGELELHILKQETSTFMSINADSILSSILIVATLINMIQISMKLTIMKTAVSKGCSALRNK